MNCREAIGVLAEFWKPVALTGRAEDVEMPAEIKARLRSLRLEGLRRGRESV
jgi:hypothetical protein